MAIRHTLLYDEGKFTERSSVCHGHGEQNRIRCVSGSASHSELWRGETVERGSMTAGHRICCAGVLVLGSALVAIAQQSPEVSTSANPGRPSVSTPATLTPVGYFQFQVGYLGATDSPEFSSQSSINAVVNFSMTSRVELLVSSQPYAHSHVEGQQTNEPGGVSLGIQGVIHHGKDATPTIAVSYFHQIYGGKAPDLDIGSSTNNLLILASGDLKGFHYDANLFFNEVVKNPIRRAQFGQSLSISHPIGRKFGVTGEIWHFSQPFLRSNAVGTLWALNYNVKENLVLDGGFNRGLTRTSTQWELFGGFTYLLPHKIRFR